MFDSRMTIAARLSDAADLIIDFATLGEYGLEPVFPRPPACEARRRPGAMRSTGSWAAAIDRFAAPGRAL
jgi:hypothetical protein